MSSSHYRQLAYRAVQIEWVGTEPDGNSPSFPGDVGDAQSPQLHDPSAVEQHEHAGETSPRVDGPFVEQAFEQLPSLLNARAGRREGRLALRRHPESGAQLVARCPAQECGGSNPAGRARREPEVESGLVELGDGLGPVGEPGEQTQDLPQLVASAGGLPRCDWAVLLAQLS